MPFKIKRVAAALMAEGIASSANYISSWKCFVTEMTPEKPGCSLARRAVNRVLSKYGIASQAAELDVVKLRSSQRLLAWAPLCSGGPIFPFMIVLVTCLMMWRGIELRSMRRSQIAEDEDLL